MSWWKVVIGALVVAGLGWLGWYATRPVPGVEMADQGRDHVTPEQVAASKYNSNPPTSGPHLATWVKSGIYNTPQSEGELIHSLEHGYVIISYNCNIHLTHNSTFKFQTLNFSENVYAHEESSSAEATADAEGSPSAPLRPATPDYEGQATSSAITESDGCQALVKNLTELANKKKLWKLIVVSRPQLDTTIALAAWTYIDKFDPPAGGFDAGRVERFIDFHRDQGPEKTME